MTPHEANAAPTSDGPTPNEPAAPDLDELGDELLARLPTRLALDIFDAVEFTGEFLRDDIDSSGPDEWWRIAALLQLELAADELEGAGAPLVSHGLDGPPPAVAEVLGFIELTLRRVGRELAAQPLWAYDNDTDPHALLALVRALLHLDAARQALAAAGDDRAGGPAGRL